MGCPSSHKKGENHHTYNGLFKVMAHDNDGYIKALHEKAQITSKIIYNNKYINK
jgi:hypothetical protein